MEINALFTLFLFSYVLQNPNDVAKMVHGHKLKYYNYFNKNIYRRCKHYTFKIAGLALFAELINY